MSSTARKVLEEALNLPDEERADVAAALLESLDGPPDPGVEEAWREEIARRLQEVREGKVQLIPWQEVRRRLRGEQSSDDR